VGVALHDAVRTAITDPFEDLELSLVQNATYRAYSGTPVRAAGDAQRNPGQS